MRIDDVHRSNAADSLSLDAGNVDSQFSAHVVYDTASALPSGGVSIVHTKSKAVLASSASMAPGETLSASGYLRDGVTLTYTTPDGLFHANLVACHRQ